MADYVYPPDNSFNPHHNGYGLEVAVADYVYPPDNVSILIIMDTGWKRLVLSGKYVIPSFNPHHNGYGLEVEKYTQMSYQGTEFQSSS